MGSYNSLPLTANIKPLWSCGKTLTIILPSKTLTLTITDPSTTISKLISQLNVQHPSRYPIISLKTLDGLEALDYYLSLPEKDLSQLPSNTQLIAVFFTPVPRRFSCSTFQIVKVLGKGAFSLVTLVRKKDTGMMYAMKSIEKQRVLKELSITQVLSEKRILCSIDHPFVCKMYWAFHSRNKLHIVMEYYPGGELFYHLRRVGRFSEEDARFYFAEVLMSLKYLHQKDIAYRDLKPENVVIDVDGHIKLTDFGLSKMDMREESQSFCGSPEYMSPEMLGNKGHTKIVDLYCLGVLLYELLTGKPPFHDRDRKQMYLKILRAPLVIPNFLSDAAKDMLVRLLERNPNKRIGSKNGIIEVMQHPWCKMVDFDRVMEKRVEPPFVPDLNSSNIGEGYSRIQTNLEFFSDSEPGPEDEFKQFEYNIEPDLGKISKYYFESRGRAQSFDNLKTEKGNQIGLSGNFIRKEKCFTNSRMMSPTLSINITKSTLSEIKEIKGILPGPSKPEIQKLITSRKTLMTYIA